MSILTAEFPPSTGDATLAGFSVTKQPEKTRRRIGYCPQFDAHFANMTGREHIELYASIKGIPKNAVKDAVAEKLREVGLNDFDNDRLCSNYSGGMKRRLSLAIATIGSPQILFLDECSTGVDPGKFPTTIVSSLLLLQSDILTLFFFLSCQCFVVLIPHNFAFV